MNCLYVLAEIMLKVGISRKLKKALNLIGLQSFDAEPHREPMDVDPIFSSENHDLDLLIAPRKGTKSCTQYPVSKFVSYEYLSPTF